MKTLVLGLGNPLLTDDGIGTRVAETVQELLPADAGVDVIEVSVGGLRLMEAMLGYERVILVDAFLQRDGRPGRIHRLTLDDIETCRPTQHSLSPHDTTLGTALAVARELGLTVPAEVVILGIEVEEIAAFSDTPTPAVHAALPRAVEAVLAELELEHPSPPTRATGKSM